MSLSSCTSDSKFHACPVVSTHPVWRFWKCKHSGGKSLEPDLPQILLRVIARTDNSETLADWNQHDDSCHRASERHWDTENSKSDTPKICNQPGSLRLQTSQGTVGHSRAQSGTVAKSNVHCVSIDKDNQGHEGQGTYANVQVLQAGINILRTIRIRSSWGQLALTYSKCRNFNVAISEASGCGQVSHWSLSNSARLL